MYYLLTQLLRCELTNQAVSELGIRLKLLSMVGHSLAEKCYREGLLSLLEIGAFRKGFDIDCHGFLHALHTYSH